MHYSAMRLYIITHGILNTPFQGDKDILSQELEDKAISFYLIILKKKTSCSKRGICLLFYSDVCASEKNEDGIGLPLLSSFIFIIIFCSLILRRIPLGEFICIFCLRHLIVGVLVPPTAAAIGYNTNNYNCSNSSSNDASVKGNVHGCCKGGEIESLNSLSWKDPQGSLSPIPL